MILISNYYDCLRGLKEREREIATWRRRRKVGVCVGGQGEEDSDEPGISLCLVSWFVSLSLRFDDDLKTLCDISSSSVDFAYAYATLLFLFS